MFKLSELECFDSMMFRMFKQEMNTVITRHETNRFVLVDAFGRNRKINEKYCLITLQETIAHGTP